MEAIMESLIKIAALVILLIGSYLAKRLDKLLDAKLSREEAEVLDKLIDTLVAAADQMFKAEDFDGSRRLDYVEGMLIAEGYNLTETVRAQIESKVFKINQIQQGS